mgnify:FL=1|jgi:hypothetical protein
MRPVGEAVEFAQFPIYTHEGREAGRLRPRPFAAFFQRSSNTLTRAKNPINAPTTTSIVRPSER